MQHFTSADGVRLVYRDEGRGRPVVCLPGLTRDGRDFDYLAPHLAEVRLIRPDYRGRGGSDFADPATYSVPIEAGDVIGLMDHLGLARAAVIGTSRGGLIAMTLAALAKPRLQGICLNDIGPEIGQEGLDTIASYIGRAPRFPTRAAMAAAMPEAMAGFAKVPASRWLEEVERHTTLTEAGLGLTYDPKLREVFLAAYGQPPVDLWPLFEAMAGLPLGLIRGANSTLLTGATAAEIRRRRPDMIFAEVPDRGHIPFLDEPEALAATRGWLALLP
jgi:pimeloyl-ACP methyl ester carboxylesterase